MKTKQTPPLRKGQRLATVKRATRNTRGTAFNIEWAPLRTPEQLHSELMKFACGRYGQQQPPNLEACVADIVSAARYWCMKRTHIALIAEQHNPLSCRPAELAASWRAIVLLLNTLQERIDTIDLGCLEYFGTLAQPLVTSVRDRRGKMIKSAFYDLLQTPCAESLTRLSNVLHALSLLLEIASNSTIDYQAEREKSALYRLTSAERKSTRGRKDSLSHLATLVALQLPGIFKQHDMKFTTYKDGFAIFALRCVLRYLYPRQRGFGTLVDAIAKVQLLLNIDAVERREIQA